MKPLRLRGRKTSERVLRHGRMWKGKTMTIHWLSGSPKNDPGRHGVFLGTFASGKMEKSAVKRNRMRRRCREALRVALLEGKNLPTVQLLLSPRSPSLTCDFGALRADVDAFLSTSPSWQTKNDRASSSSS